MVSIFKNLKEALADKFISQDAKEFFKQQEEDRLVEELTQEECAENPFSEKYHCTKCGDDILGDEDSLCGSCAN